MRNESGAARRPFLGILLGGIDRVSSAGGKALLDEYLILPSGPLRAAQATFLEATFGGLLLLSRLYLPPLIRRRSGAGTPGGTRSAGTARSPLLAFLTFLTIAGDKAMLVIALTSIPFGIAGGIYYTFPLLIPIIGGLRRGSKRRAALLTLFAAAIAAGLILLVNEDESANAGNFPLGVVCAIGAGASRTLFLPVTDRLIRRCGRRHTERAIAWSMLLVGALAGGASTLTTSSATFLSWPIIGWALAVGLLNNALPRIIQVPARAHAGDAVYAVFLAASPVIATLIGVALLGNRLTLEQWAGLIVIAVAAAAVANLSFGLRARGRAPFVELATARTRLQSAVASLRKLEWMLRELHSRVATQQASVAAAAIRAADAEVAAARARVRATRTTAMNAQLAAATAAYHLDAALERRRALEEMSGLS